MQDIKFFELISTTAVSGRDCQIAMRVIPGEGNVVFGPDRVQLFRPLPPEDRRDLDPAQTLGGRAFRDSRATTSQQQTSRVCCNKK